MSSVTPRKRQKTRLACNPCRSKKTGCDGRRPACSSCTLKGWQDQCVYQGSVLPSRQGLNLRRVQRLEEGPFGDESIAFHVAGPSESHAHAATEDVGEFRKANSAVSSNLSSQNTSPRGSDTYGPSSNISFLRQITVAADPHKYASDPQSSSMPTLLGFSTSRPSSPRASPNPISLPDMAIADAFLQSYWDYVHPIFPVLHRPSFVHIYARLLQPTASHPCPDLIYQATLSIVLALGSQRTENIAVAQRDHLADRLYKQSCHLVSVDLLDESSLHVVQLFLLRGIYLHYSTYADRCWNTIGVAIRVALGLGLQDENDSSRNQLTREMRRRVWHCCVTLDRLTATTFGRKALLPPSQLNSLPAAIDDEHLLEVGDGVQPQGCPSRLAFFLHSMELIDVLYEILELFYEQKPVDLTVDPTTKLQDVLRRSSWIDDFEDRLPDFLRVDSNLLFENHDRAACLQMQANVLKSRVLWIRLLLLRPSLLAQAKKYSCSTSPTSERQRLRLTDTLQHSTHELCLETAHELLEEMHGKLGSLRQNSAWHVLLCRNFNSSINVAPTDYGESVTFAAASTLVASTLCPDLDVDLDQDRPKASWERGIEIFEFHKTRIPSATKGTQALQMFRNTITALKQKQGEVTLVGEPAESISDSFQLGLDDIVSFNELFSSGLLNEGWYNTPRLDLSQFGVS